MNKEEKGDKGDEVDKDGTPFIMILVCQGAEWNCSSEYVLLTSLYQSEKLRFGVLFQAEIMPERLILYRVTCPNLGIRALT